MTNQQPAKSATIDGLTVSPALDLVTNAAQVPAQHALIDGRVLLLCVLAVGLGAVAAFVSQFLVGLIDAITNLAYFGEFSLEMRAPAEAIPRLGLWSIPIPVVGALIIGVMARFGSKAIRGHGIPEAMEQVLTNDSRIPARVILLKPLSSAISIGTGGPFGAEGPIIATGGALGSALGQLIHTTSAERKTLLACGAAAGMAATFGSPVSAVLLAVELLLFEYRPRSIIPVALAASAATGIRMMIEGMEPVFAMTDLQQPPGTALAAYVGLGAVMGLVSVIVTKAVYSIEDTFEKLPIHWMWWPAIGAIAVGVVGYFAPNTLGVGYYNISNILSNNLTVSAVLFLCLMKFLSWSISLGSGTSGGTLAPLFTIGGGIGFVLGTWLSDYVPWLGVDPRIAALVGMASIFSGASRAMLASAVFAFETTLQPFGLLPLLGSCATAYLVSALSMRTSIMTEKISRRGVRTPEEYKADVLDQVNVREIASTHPVTVHADDTVEQVRVWMASGAPKSSHHGFPVITSSGVLIGVVTRQMLTDATLEGGAKISEIVRQPVRFVYEDSSVRQAANHMVRHGIGRLPVVSRQAPHLVLGIVTRSDILSVFQRNVEEFELQPPTIKPFSFSSGSRQKTKNSSDASPR
ncbi:chloride channel protein [Planctomicrobium sp. SH661]|uniref:chloride channel protein n=1 Tax=Planctomicrobium sp. SH661 TaxID=3448124 RepID=UPI003F5B0145